MMFGPKKTSLLACVPICLAWVLMSRAEDIYVVYTSRMLTGHITVKHILVVCEADLEVLMLALG